MTNRFCFTPDRGYCFPAAKEAVRSLIDLQTLRWTGFSHFEWDACGTLPEWQTAAPWSTAFCNLVGHYIPLREPVGATRAQAQDFSDDAWIGLRGGRATSLLELAAVFQEVLGPLNARQLDGSRK
jgi:hypothetical protein